MVFLFRSAYVLSLPALLSLLDWMAEKHKVFMTWETPEWRVYLTGLWFSFSAWTMALLFLEALRYFKNQEHSKWRQIIYAKSIATLLIAVHLWMAIIISMGYLKEFFHYPTVHVLEFAVNEPLNAWSMVAGVLSPICILTLILGPLITVWHFRKSGFYLSRWTEKLPKVWRLGLIGFLLLNTIISGGMALGWHRFQNPLPLDANWMRGLYQFVLMQSGNKTNLQTPHRLDIIGIKTQNPFNTLLIINESLRSDAFVPQTGFINNLNATVIAPRLQNIFADSLTTVFSKAWTNSGATNVSVPSILTGVAPEMTSYDFHRYPTLFNVAHALGFKTFLITCQDWQWEHFDEFFLGNHVDYVVTRRSFHRPRDNDLGVADALPLDSLRKELKLLKAQGQKFFGVIQFNATHYPYYGGPGKNPYPDGSLAKYQTAVHYLDSVNAEIYHILQEEDLLSSTLIYGTADHGENVHARNLGRLASYYEEAMRVPYWISYPAQAMEIEQFKNLRAMQLKWKNSPVQNLDITPTVLDFWGVLNVEPFRGKYLGHSLWQPGWDSVRVLSAQNTCEIRAWSFEGCYVQNGNFKFIMNNVHSPRLYNLQMDPIEDHNLWEDKTQREQQVPWIRKHIHAIKGRLELCQRLGKQCPENILK